jgi:hypothetical protein
MMFSIFLFQSALPHQTNLVYVFTAAKWLNAAFHFCGLQGAKQLFVNLITKNCAQYFMDFKLFIYSANTKQKHPLP